MKFSRLSIFSLSILLGVNAFALNINNTAGQLSAVVTDPQDVTTLTITGGVNAADFDFIGNKLTSLTSLDLSGATIAAYNGERVLIGNTEYEANQLPPYALMGSKIQSITLPASIKTIGEGALASTKLTSITIPNSVTSIGANAFADCKQLTSVTIPASVTSLGDGIFMGCTSLTSANIAAQANVISPRMFEGCTVLTSVTANSVTSIGNAAFNGCTALKQFSFPSTLKTIGENAFYGSGLTTANLSGCNSLTTIGQFAFAKCRSLTSATFTSSVATMGQGVFFDDESLTTVTLPSNLKTIPAFTFKGDTAIRCNSLPNSVEKIDDYALTGWSHIETFTLPINLSYIGDGAMEDWTGLKSLYANEIGSVPELGENVWENVEQSNVILYVDENNFDNYSSTPQWDQFKIQIATSEVESVTDALANNDIDFYFVGHTLFIRSAGADITDVVIYDLDGRRRLARSASSQLVEVDTSTFSRVVLIAQVRLANGTVATVKISKI